MAGSRLGIATPSGSSNLGIISGQRGPSLASSGPTVSATPPASWGPPINGTNAFNRVPSLASAAAAQSGNGASAGGAGPQQPSWNYFGAPNNYFGAPNNYFGAPNNNFMVSRTNQVGAPSSGVAMNAGPGVFVNNGPGVFVNRGSGVFVNRGPVSNAPAQSSGPNSPYPQPDTNSAWYQRYQQAQQYRDGSSGYDMGTYGPVFLNPPVNYNIAHVDQVYMQSTPPPIVVNGDEQQQQQGVQQPGPQAQANADTAKESAQEQDRSAQGTQRDDRDQRRSANQLTPEKLHDLMVQGTQLFLKGRYNEAASTFLRVTLADRANVDATLAYAVARFATGDYQISALAVQRGIHRLPDVVNSDFDVRSRYGDLQQFANHLVRLEQFVRDHPDSHDGWIVLGFIRHFSGQRELAVTTFQRLRTMSRADGVLADIFLSARPARAQTQPADVAASQPAAAPTAGNPPVPPGGDQPDQVPVLISIDPLP